MNACAGSGRPRSPSSRGRSPPAFGGDAHSWTTWSRSAAPPCVSVSRAAGPTSGSGSASERASGARPARPLPSPHHARTVPSNPGPGTTSVHSRAPRPRRAPVQPRRARSPCAHHDASSWVPRRLSLPSVHSRRTRHAAAASRGKPTQQPGSAPRCEWPNGYERSRSQ